MIAAERSPGSPPEDLDEQRAILDSIRIESAATWASRFAAPTSSTNR